MNGQRMAATFFIATTKLSQCHIMYTLRMIPANPLILKFLGFFENPNGYVMKYYSGTLDALISNASIELTAVDAFRFSKDIARGLQFIHSFDVVHFSIRPQSIFLDFIDTVGFQPVICDFDVRKFNSKFFILMACFCSWQSQ